MDNKAILEKLFETDNNAKNVNEYLEQWNKQEPFPVNAVKSYIRLGEWNKEDYTTHVELVIMKVMPKWFYRVYLCMKEFVSQPYAELNSEQEAFSKFMGYPMESEHDKAFCVYEFAIQYYSEED